MQVETKRIPLVYCRVSSERQKREGGGLESQEQRCCHYSNQKGYGEPIMVFKDSFTGGGDFMNRPEMRELINYIDGRPHKSFVVIFDDLSRFARDTEFHLKLRAIFSSRGVKLECLNYNFDESVEGKFVETIFAAKNQLEREQNRRQVIQKQKARMERGYWPFRSPRGYTMKMTENGNVCFPNEEALILKEGLEGFAYKRFIKQIDLARFLQEEGFFPKTRPAEKYLETTRTMLLNPFYSGYLESEEWEVKRFKGKHEALVSDEIFNANVKRLKGESKCASVRQDIRQDFELRGLVLCEGCDNPLTAYYSTSHTGKKHAYYSCQNKPCLLRSKTIRKSKIDEEFKKLLSENCPKEELIALVSQMFIDIWKDEIEGINFQEGELASRKTKLEEEIRKFADEIIDTDSAIVKDQYKKRIEEKTQEINSIDEILGKKIDYAVPYRTSYEKITGMIKSPYKIWEKGTVKQKQELFSFMFDEKIIFEHKGGYRTPEKSCLYKLFDRLEDGHSVLVEVGGIEPPCSKV